MRKIVLICLSLLLMTACERDKRAWRFSYIQSYYTYSDIQLKAVGNGMEIDVLPVNSEFLADIEGNGDRQAYENLRAHYGDNSCSNPSYDGHIVEGAFAIDYESIELIAQCDWDGSHAQGSSLADVATVHLRSYYPYIASGYKEYGAYSFGATIPLPNVEPADLLMLGVLTPQRINEAKIATINITPPAVAGEYPVTVKMTTTDGQVFEKSITLTVE